MMKAVAVAMAGQIMRRILLDQARRRVAAKRGGNVERVNLDELPAIVGGRRGGWVGCTFSVVREFKMEIPTL
jgi:ECF sigma factor